MGASSESQPAGSLHITTQICCFLMHDASSQNCLSDEVIIKLIKKKVKNEYFEAYRLPDRKNV